LNGVPNTIAPWNNLLLPLAGELQGALADGVADRLVGRDGGEPGGLGLALVTQEVNQAQCLTLRSHGNGFFGGSILLCFVPRNFLFELIDELLE
jgi:hypothetical protein